MQRDRAKRLTPVLKKKKLTATERQRLESSDSPARDVFMNVSVMNADATSWGRGEDTILTYSIERGDERICLITRFVPLARHQSDAHTGGRRPSWLLRM
jgi:hypothetical protein